MAAGRLREAQAVERELLPAQQLAGRVEPAAGLGPGVQLQLVDIRGDMSALATNSGDFVVGLTLFEVGLAPG